MDDKIKAYHESQTRDDQTICNLLYEVICENLPEAEHKIWHAHPVWFLDGNPIVGYSKLKAGIRLMFWSGASFGEDDLKPGTGKFKDASKLYTATGDIHTQDISRWLEKARTIQWDYKNLMKRKGKLVRLL